MSYLPAVRGLPLYWRNELSGGLAKAVQAYLEHRINGLTLTDEQVDRLRCYFTQWIDAPCWDTPEQLAPELADLRSSVRELQSATEIQDWIYKAMAIGMDPL